MREVPSRQVKTKAPSGANHLREKATSKTSQHASSVKFALCSGAEGSSLSADSGAYAASAPKGAPKVLSREAMAKALCANSEATVAPLTSSALLGSTRLAAFDKVLKTLAAKLKLKHH